MAAYISFQPKDYFNTILYTGDDGASQAQTGVGFSADLTWIKDRDSTEEHVWTDTVRGATYWIRSNAENGSAALATGLLSWESDGFTVGNNGVVGTTDDYVAWNWKMGTTSGIATNGSTTITPTDYTFDQTTRSSIVKYTGNLTAGAKVAHGLGTTPDLIIIKDLNSTTTWIVYQSAISESGTKYLNFNETDSIQTNTNRFNDTAPDDVNFTLGTTTYVNGSGDPYIAYCFARKRGFSAFSSYIGNDNADGPMIYTGFRPGFVMIKRYDSTGAWQVWDNKRPGYNATTGRLYPNGTDAESNTQQLDILSNGFKYRNTGAAANASGGNYIYAAFSAYPLISSNDVPGTAK
tara:strand:+ start:426 stop:1472 length:1047 start_codon:yes stop_codon:yes gene_type:complete